MTSQIANNTIKRIATFEFCAPWKLLPQTLLWISTLLTPLRIIAWRVPPLISRYFAQAPPGAPVNTTRNKWMCLTREHAAGETRMWFSACAMNFIKCLVVAVVMIAMYFAQCHFMLLAHYLVAKRYMHSLFITLTFVIRFFSKWSKEDAKSPNFILLLNIRYNLIKCDLNFLVILVKIMSLSSILFIEKYIVLKLIRPIPRTLLASNCLSSFWSTLLKFPVELNFRESEIGANSLQRICLR